MIPTLPDNFSDCLICAPAKFHVSSTGFNSMTSGMPVQCSHHRCHRSGFPLKTPEILRCTYKTIIEDVQEVWIISLIYLSTTLYLHFLHCSNSSPWRTVTFCKVIVKYQQPYSIMNTTHNNCSFFVNWQLVRFSLGTRKWLTITS